MKTLAQSQRFTVYTIIDSLVAKHREGNSVECAHQIFFSDLLFPALKNMGAEFLDNYLALAEGEKDPRNLLVAFAIARVILIEFDIKHHVEVGLTRDLSFYGLTKEI